MGVGVQWEQGFSFAKRRVRGWMVVTVAPRRERSYRPCTVHFEMVNVVNVMYIVPE